jgi:biopolymer transport protein ExbB/TolQ
VGLFADIENDVIFELAEALRVPVLILTVAALAVVLVELGGFFVELSRRRRRDIGRLRTVAEGTRRVLIEGGGAERARKQVSAVAWSVSMGRTLARLVDDWGKPDAESMMSKALAEHDFGSLRRLERTRILVRAGPALGLMGTLIPLSPALAGLAAGDVQELSENLRVAFSVTVLGLLIGAIAFGISLVRDRLYSQDLSDLEFVANRLTSTGALIPVPPPDVEKEEGEAEKKDEETAKKDGEPETKDEEAAKKDGEPETKDEEAPKDGGPAPETAKSEKEASSS